MRGTGDSVPMVLVLVTHLKIVNIVDQDPIRQHVTETKRAGKFGVGVALQHSRHGRLDLALHLKMH